MMRERRSAGRKRQALVDTDGRALVLKAQPASVQDRDGAGPLLRASRSRFPFIKHAFADAGYAGERVAQASRILFEIVRKQAGQVGFADHPRRSVVERFFAWLGRNRSAEPFLYAASVMLPVRRLGR
jgi:transposase